MHWTIRQTRQRRSQIHKVEQITGLDGYSAVVDFALSYTIANLAQTGKEGTVTEKTQIKVEYSADALDNEGVLTNQQISDYAESLHDYIAQNYPGAEIDVVLGIRNQVDVYVAPTDDLDHDYAAESRIGADVEQLIADHWQPWIDKVAMQVPVYGTLEVVTSFVTLNDELNKKVTAQEAIHYMDNLRNALTDELGTEVKEINICIGQFDSIETWDIDGDKIAPDEVTVRRVTECIGRAIAKFN